LPLGDALILKLETLVREQQLSLGLTQSEILDAKL
jgi:hypothetical protein